jgi:hypothetical protein
VKGASIGEEIFVRHRATEVVLGADPPHDLKGMEPTQIGFVLLLVAEGAVLLNDRGNLMLLAIHLGVIQEEPDEERGRPLYANQFLEDPTFIVSEFGYNEGTRNGGTRGRRGRGRIRRYQQGIQARLERSDLCLG